jgi:predicted acetyltransferase
MHPPSQVTLRRAEASEQAVIANLSQLYVHDFSEYWRGQARGEVDGHGLFPSDPHLGTYWREPDRAAFLVKHGHHIAGFALVNRHSHSGRPIDQAVAEFFILRKHRRGGTGRAAAHALFDLYSGQWEAAVARANTGALAFWRDAIAAYPHARAIEEIDVHSEDWNGPILRFTIPHD